MKKLIFISGLLASTICFGADWRYVTSGGGLGFYVDNSFYKYDASSKTVDVWTKTTKKDIFNDNYYTSSKTLTKYSCVNKESKQLANIEYSSNGSVLNSSTKLNGKFELIFPDSVGEVIWEISCSSKGKGFAFPKYEPEYVDLEKLGYKAP